MGDANDNALICYLQPGWREVCGLLCAFMGGYQLKPARFAPAEAGACAHATRRIASVLQQNDAVDVGD